MFGNRSATFQTQFVPWPGKLPYHFKQLRGILISKMSVAWSAHIPSLSVAFCLLEILLELLRSNYPLSLLRAVIHSLPCWPPAILARGVFRAFQKVVGPSGPTAMKNKGPGRGILLAITWPKMAPRGVGIPPSNMVTRASFNCGQGKTVTDAVGPHPQAHLPPPLTPNANAV